VRRHKGVEIDPEKLPLDDPATFALLQRGETKGIFQLESGGMRDLLTKMKPDSFNDIIATSALYRPGPLEGGMVMTYVDVKHGRQPVPKVHPIVDEVLAETYGVMVYQEQVMRILNRVGGIELSSAYRCIKAISKKKLSIIEKYREEFIAGARANNLDEATAVEMFEMIEKFAGYGFNKSHSTAYAAIAYQTAYLKAHFPYEFMAALLSCGMESSERISEQIDDCRRMHIEILPPDVNGSDVEFGVAGDKLTFGLGAIKGIGDQVVTAVVAEREANGPFRNIFDLAERLDPGVLNKSTLETLIKAGALDSFGANRAQHMLVVERAVQSAASLYRDRARGQKSLFGGDEPTAAQEPVAQPLPESPEWSHTLKLANEKESLGFYLTSHPLSEHAARLEAFASHNTTHLAAADDNAEIVLAGIISAIKRASTKKPSRNGHTRYVNFDLEDPHGMVRCIMWPEEYARLGDRVKAEAVCVVRGRVDRRGREPNIVVTQLMSLEEAEQEFTKKVAIKFQRGLHTQDDMVRVREILNRFPGRTEVVLVVDSADETEPEKRRRYVLSASQDLRVACTSELRRELESALGEEHFRFHAEKPKPNGGNARRQGAMV
jgi:DNA polymerase-3 subunit alpha